MKKIAVLGSTGSVGRQALEVAARRSDILKVEMLSCGSNIHLLCEQIERFRPAAACIADDSARARINTEKYAGTRFYFGQQAQADYLRQGDYDTVLAASSGLSAVRAVHCALARKKTVALAAKEVLSLAGKLTMELARHTGAEIIPVDSEHSALWQCIKTGGRGELKNAVITASGGAFRDLPAGALSAVTPEQALAHPTWSMGKKITVDSATLVNKGLEVIEACHLFGLDEKNVITVLHPQSVVHAMAEFSDGSFLAHLGPASMELPIQYALLGGERRPCAAQPLDIAALGSLNFSEIDHARFPGLQLCRSAYRAGDSHCAALTAADDVLVDAFLKGSIKFTDIPYYIERVLSGWSRPNQKSVEEAEQLYKEAEAITHALINK